MNLNTPNYAPPSGLNCPRDTKTTKILFCTRNATLMYRTHQPPSQNHQAHEKTRAKPHNEAHRIDCSMGSGRVSSSWESTFNEFVPKNQSQELANCPPNANFSYPEMSGEGQNKCICEWASTDKTSRGIE